MVIILLAILGIMIGAGTLVSRTTQGQLGSLANSQTYGARKAAEAGISRLIGEWNKQENRMLLASGSPASTWITTNERLRNPCTATTIYMGSATPIGGADLAAYRTGAWINVVNNDTNDIKRRYRLRRVTFRKSNRQISTTRYTQTAFGTDRTSVPSGAQPFPDMSTNTSTFEVPKPFTLGDRNDSHGYLEVEVEGQVLRNGTDGMAYPSAAETQPTQVNSQASTASAGVGVPDYTGMAVPSVWRTNRTHAAAKVDAMSSGGMDDYEIPAFLRKQAD